MKTILILFISTILLTSCNSGAIEKPDNLIKEDQMVDIIYDLSLLEAIRLDNPASLEQRKINPSAYIYKKYKIDSLQFAKSDQYYASDIKKYAGIYDRVTKKLDNDKTAADALLKKIPVKKEEAKTNTPAFNDTIAQKRIEKKQLIKRTSNQK